MTVLIYIINGLILFGIAFYLYKVKSGLRPFFIPAFTLKILSGIGIGILYSSYYTFGDTWSYFHEANRLLELSKQDFNGYLSYLVSSDAYIFESIYLGRPRAIFFTKIVSVLSFITGQNYWLISAYFSLATFTCLWFLATKLDKLFPKNKVAILLSILFLPSAVFWSSGIIKESFAVCFAALIVIQYLKWSVDKKVDLLSIILFTVSSVILWKIKYYYAAGLISIVIASLIVQLTLDNSQLSKYGKKGILVMYTLLLFSALLVIGLIKPTIGINNLIHPIVVNNQAFVERSEVGDYIQYYNLHESWWSIIINTPNALFSGLFRPFLWEVDSFFKLVYSLENLLMLVLVIFRLKSIPKSLSNSSLIHAIGIILFTCIMISFLALSAPNYGTLIRYKSMVLPFFVLLLTIDQPYFQKLNSLSIWKGKLKD